MMPALTADQQNEVDLAIADLGDTTDQQLAELLTPIVMAVNQNQEDLDSSVYELTSGVITKISNTGRKNGAAIDVLLSLINVALADRIYEDGIIIQELIQLAYPGCGILPGNPCGTTTNGDSVVSAVTVQTIQDGLSPLVTAIKTLIEVCAEIRDRMLGVPSEEPGEIPSEELPSEEAETIISPPVADATYTMPPPDLRA